MHAVDLCVVGGVRNDHQLARPHGVEHPAGELRPTGPAGEDRYHSSSGSPVSFTPAVVL